MCVSLVSCKLFFSIFSFLSSSQSGHQAAGMGVNQTLKKLSIGMSIYSNTNHLEKQLAPIDQRQLLLSLGSALLGTLLVKGGGKV